jgi:hypothetical protein
MALAFQPPSIKELSFLSGIMNEEEVLRLVEHCAPMLQVKADLGGTVHFENEMLQHHLLLGSDKVFESSSPLHNGDEETLEAQRYHGVLAWRCFAYVDDMFKSRSGLNMASDAEGAIRPNESLKSNGRPYLMKFCLRHAIKGKAELADDLVQNLKNFWMNPSLLRTFWLADNMPPLPSTFTDRVSFEGMTALHTAAAFGYDRLVTSLIPDDQSHEAKDVDRDADTPVNNDGYTPVRCDPGVVASFASSFMLLIAASYTLLRFITTIRP